MLGMGMTLGKEDYQILAQRPLDIFIGAIAQYTIMPLLAIGIARAFDLSPGLTLGLVLVGTCPGGVSSNIMSFLAKGDVAFSVGMTTVSTVLAPVMTPLWMTYLVGLCRLLPLLHSRVLSAALLPFTVTVSLNPPWS